eukprot:TRINITY_DN69792_c0_g1_i1.p1 TRINITY_DN69792_c0_g1~~TRINITY_DN69792_c0_g1_i1.p1  ORF type:complete len:448 (+),score=48.61 TRINITY_DN69792_c0_g1_i1:63-1406(+)
MARHMPIEHPGLLRAARMAFCRSGPAAWDPLPQGFSLGSGPTIVHALGPVSKLHDDVALIDAAARGDSAEIALLLPRVSSPNVRTRSTAGQSHPTTALHVAASHGHLEAVLVLLAGGADPRNTQSGLRRLTPLHEASTVAVAEALVAAKASPIAADPREPDPSWYHKQHGRQDVAAAVSEIAATFRSTQSPSSAASTQLRRRRPSSANSAARDSNSRKAYPCMTGSEVAAARRLWSTTGGMLRLACRGSCIEAANNDVEQLRAGATQKCRSTGKRVTNAGARASASQPPTTVSVEMDGLLVGGVSGSAAAAMHLECAICMGSLGQNDECIALPCNGFDTAGLRSGTPPSCPAMGRASTMDPHAFHSSCLEHWWGQSCQCPTCRRDVRQWLRSCGVGEGTPKSLEKAPAAHPPCLVVGCFPPPVRREPTTPQRRGHHPLRRHTISRAP